MRYVYIKNGDVVDQVRRLGVAPKNTPEGGPDAFIGDFLKLVSHQPVLLISRGARSDSIELDALVAKTLSVDSSLSLMNKMQVLYVFFETIYLVLKFRPDRILCGSVGTMLWAAFICSFIMQVPLVQSRHSRLDMEKPSLIKRFLLAIDNFIVRKYACAVVAHGPFLRDQLMEIGVPQSRVFEFDVGYKDFREKNSDIDTKYLNDAEKYKYVLYVGRLYRDKGVFDLLDAMRDELKLGEVRLVFVGDGDDAGNLKARSKAYGFNEEQVQFLGKLQHRDIGALMMSSHVLVAPTRHAWEGRCMSVMEGLVMGIPVIAPNGGPFPYLIKDAENGLLYQTDSVLDMSAKICLAVENDELYEQIKKGAEISGTNLLIPETRFFAAVKAAFECSVTCR